jgi:pimeloyl-ACP methyl ester carboxylesterase
MAISSISSQTISYNLNNGLAIYSVGEGQIVLLMPYPHGFTTFPIAEGILAQILVDSGYRVITFDPPGTFRSTRLAQVTMSEMLDCTEETLRSLGIRNLFSIMGHSMGGLCAIAHTLANPSYVQKLVLIGSVSGGPAIARCKGMPWGMRPTEFDFWRFIFWGWQLSSALGSLALHKKFLHLLWKHSYADRTLMPVVEIAPEDNRRPAPIRDKWPMVVRHLDYSQQLKEIRVPTLVCVGRFDPQAPVSCSEELAQSLPEAHLIVFERSGHYPFIEERQHFAEILSSFLAA